MLFIASKTMRRMKSNACVALTTIKGERDALGIGEKERERKKGNDFRLIYFERALPRVID